MLCVLLRCRQALTWPIVYLHDSQSQLSSNSAANGPTSASAARRRNSGLRHGMWRFVVAATKGTGVGLRTRKKQDKRKRLVN